MSSAPAESADQKPKAANKVRKRAPKACLSCRSRKVRCDVSQRGRPCMNCYLDSETCVVTGRASRFRRNRENENVQASHPPYSGDAACDHTHSAEAVVRSRTNGEPIPQPGAEQRPVSVTSTPEAGAERNEAPIAPRVPVAPNTTHESSKSQIRPVPSHAPAERHGASTPAQPQVPNGLQWPGEQNMNFTSDITFSYYPWLAISNLANILPQDVNYLDMQGCLRVPTRAVLDEFVQQYFLHVHPLLPLFNEGDFWEMYCHQGFGAAPPEKMSLLVFQSMLFATCNFLSRDSIKALGFPSIRATRAAFYRRAKLLYDFESESSSIAIAQAALLLSFWSPATNKGCKNPNSGWLSTAIQQAKSAEAHRYYSILSGNGPHHPRLVKRQNILKRLWWCCIIRDRVLGLCVRRSIQITRAHFDFDAHPSLGYADLGDELERSKVYNPGTKRCLIEILAQIVELCVVLTDILMLVFPLDDLPGWGRQLAEEDAGKVKQCKTDLRRWYKGATLRFPMFGGAGMARMSTANSGNAKEYQHDSVILYTNMMYMYYHSSRVALCHHEILHLAVASAAPGLDGNANPDMSTIYENRHEIQDASSGVTECLKELIQLRLARWLPISAVACTALPLVLHILDVKLSSPSGPGNSFDPNTQSALKQHRLNILIEAMKTYQPQYDGVDWVSETIRHIINLAQLDDRDNGRKGGNSNNSGISDWTDILSSHPSAYLRLALTMDLSLSKNRLPEEGDFPASLRGLFTGGFSPIKILLGHGGKVPQNAAPPAPHGMASMMPQSGPSMQMLSDWAAGDQSMAFGLEAGMIRALPSDEETSPASTGLGTDGTSPDGPVVGEADVNQMADQAFSEAMDILEGNVLDAFAFRDEDTGSPSDIDGVSYDGGGDGDPAGEWVEKAWHEEDGVEFRADQETAKALLEAMDTDPVGCAA